MATTMIEAFSFGDNKYSFTLPYGECGTAAETAEKTVTIDNFALEKGATIVVKFTNKNSASSPTLNVNGTGAKSLYRYGTTKVGTSTTTSGWIAGAVFILTYDGSGWYRHYWNNTTYSTFTKSGTNAASGLVPAPSTTAGTTKYLREDCTWAVPPDTKNTAGSTDSSSKLFLIGATSQSANATTYSHNTAYVGTDGHLYSNSSKVFSTSYAPEAYLSWGGQNIVSGVTPISMAMSEEHSGNKAAFIDGNAISIEYCTDGSTFTDAGISKKDKTALFTTSASISIGGSTAMTSSNYSKLKTRVTLTAQDGTNAYIYTDVRKMLVNMSTAVSVNMLIETLQGDSSSWATVGTYEVKGWSGWNDIPLKLTLGGSTSQKDRPWKIRFTFSLNTYNTSSATTKSILGFRIFGQNSWNIPSTLGKTGHLYSYDVDQNAAFPAKVKANGGFEGNLSGTASTAMKAEAVVTTESSSDVYRNVWFSTSASDEKLGKHTSFQYNPAKQTLKVNYVDGTAKAANSVPWSGVASKPNVIVSLKHHGTNEAIIGVHDDGTETSIGYTNTKNTAGSTPKSGVKLFLIGAQGQTDTSYQTFSNAKVYIDTDNCLYSNGSKVLTAIPFGDTAQVLASQSSAGTATTVSRSDHKHPFPALTSCTGTLTVAKGGTGLTTSPKILVNLEAPNAEADVFTATPRPGVYGVLAITNGGTGLSSSPSMLINLESTTADNVLEASPRPGVTGKLAVANGGTGSNSAAGARTNLAVYSKTEVDSAISTAKSELLNGAGAAYDTLKELGDLIKGNADAITLVNNLAATKVSKSGDTMTGPLAFQCGNADVRFLQVYSSTPGEYGFALQYEGTGSGNDNSLSLIAGNQTAENDVKVFTIKQDGTTSIFSNVTFSGVLNFNNNTTFKNQITASGGVKGDLEGNADTATSAYNVAWSGVNNKPSYYDAKAIKAITRNGLTFTYTCMDGSTGTFTQKDDNTTYTAGTGLTLDATNKQFYVSTANASQIINALEVGGSALTKDDYIITQYADGNSASNVDSGNSVKYYRRKASNVINATLVKSAIGASSSSTDFTFLKKDGTWTDPRVVATSSSLGCIKSGGDITIDSTGIVSVNDNSHSHTMSNVTGLQTALDGKYSKNGGEISGDVNITGKLSVSGQIASNGGAVLKHTSGVNTVNLTVGGNAAIIVQRTSNPYIGYIDETYSSTTWYTQANEDSFGIGAGWSNSVIIDKNGGLAAKTTISTATNISAGTSIAAGTNITANGSITAGGVVTGSCFKSDTSAAGIRPSNSNEVNFSSSTSYLYFGYANRVSGSTPVSSYYFGRHANGEVQNGDLFYGSATVKRFTKIGNCKMQYDSSMECLSFIFE